MTTLEAIPRALNPGYMLLPETSPGGCRIVVDEHASLKTNGGQVGVLQPGSIIVEWTRTYRGEGAEAPFSSGNYAVSWEGPVAELHIFTADLGQPGELRCHG